MEIIQPAGFPPPRGYSNGIVASGRLLFVAGQVGWDAHAELVSGRFADQFDQALANVLAVVTAAGGKPESVTRLTIYVVDRGEYLEAAGRSASATAQDGTPLSARDAAGSAGAPRARGAGGNRGDGGP